MSRSRPHGRRVWALPALWIVIAALASGSVAAAPPDHAMELGSSDTAPSATLLENTCPSGEMYDDGEAENAYSGNPATIDNFQGTQLFTPSAYPTRYTKVCIGLTSLADSTLEFTIEVRDDDGPDGTPGSLLRSRSVSVSDLPTTGLPCAWYSFDLPGPGPKIRNGSVFIGVSWNPMTYPSRFLCSDESPTTTLHTGFVNFNAASWQTAQSVFPSYRAFLVRAVPKIIRKVRLRANPKQVAAGGTAKLVARVRPCVSGDRHRIKLQMKQGGWKNAGAKRTSGAQCKAVFKQGIDGPLKFRAKAPGNRRYLPAKSRAVQVRTV